MIFSNFNTVKLEDITDKMATILFARVVDSEDWSRRKQNLDKISTKRWKKLTLEKQPKIKHHVTSKTQFRWMKPCDVSGLQGNVYIVVFIPVDGNIGHKKILCFLLHQKNNLGRAGAEIFYFLYFICLVLTFHFLCAKFG